MFVANKFIKYHQCAMRMSNIRSSTRLFSSETFLSGSNANYIDAMYS